GAPTVQANLPAERRLWPRRNKQIPVFVTRPDDAEDSKPRRAWVLDRSPGGLRLLVRDVVDEGSILLVRPVSASADSAWVGVRVKSARPKDGQQALGCEFVLPTWDTFLLFS